jgi:hypothetical protein
VERSSKVGTGTKGVAVDAGGWREGRSQRLGAGQGDEEGNMRQLHLLCCICILQELVVESM